MSWGLDMLKTLMTLLLSSRNPMLALSLASIIGIAAPMIYVDTQHRKEMSAIISAQMQVIEQNSKSMEKQAEATHSVARVVERLDQRIDNLEYRLTRGDLR
jgi:hypothetical protein